MCLLPGEASLALYREQETHSTVPATLNIKNSGCLPQSYPPVDHRRALSDDGRTVPHPLVWRRCCVVLHPFSAVFVSCRTLDRLADSFDEEGSKDGAGGGAGAATTVEGIASGVQKPASTQRGRFYADESK